MQQYQQVKDKYPGALLLFRVGDFYETFGEDAVKTAQILGITLTKRANGSAAQIPLAGFPHHSLDSYLPKLVKAGQRVAICDQLEDPKLTKGIVKRGVTELLTPGVSCNEHIDHPASNNFLATLHFSKENIGLALLDITTASFLVAEGDAPNIDKLLHKFRPAEVLFSKQRQTDFKVQFGNGFYTYALDAWLFTSDFATTVLSKHFEVKNLKGFGVEHLNTALIAAGVALHYVNETEHRNLRHITAIARIDPDAYLYLDNFTIRNLELLDTPHKAGKTLIEVLDHTASPMGARLLRKWIMLPLKEQALIEERLNIVDFFCNDLELAEKLVLQIHQLGDLERLIAKVGLLKVKPRELVQLSYSLLAIAAIRQLCATTSNTYLLQLADQLDPCQLVREQIEKELVADPSVLPSKGKVIADGVNAELDRLRQIVFGGKDYLLNLQKREAAQSGIPSLKLSFNNIFGYYLEVTHAHKDKVPANWIRKQTLVHAERYVTPELKEYEEQILGAEEKILSIEANLYNDLIHRIAKFIKPIQHNAQLLANLDVLLCFALVARKNDYVKPIINNSNIIDIKDGRHPVIEKMLPFGEVYTANDVYLDSGSQQIIVITGPNMSGKSAVLRQTGLIVLIAQVGCFVPAKSAQIGLVDKLFTRVGASDNLSLGESTFMVEMHETASILNNISYRSLILLDEIGRGTATYDGISIAWAIAEYLHNHPTAKARTLFATHYHELNELAHTYDRIVNFNVSVKEVDHEIIFMRKLVPGGSAHSFGIHVAKLAGMPLKILERAQDILRTLEAQRTGASNKQATIREGLEETLVTCSIEDPLLVKLRDILGDLNINDMTPLAALTTLGEMQRLVKNHGISN